MSQKKSYIPMSVMELPQVSIFESIFVLNFCFYKNKNVKLIHYICLTLLAN